MVELFARPSRVAMVNPANHLQVSSAWGDVQGWGAMVYDNALFVNMMIFPYFISSPNSIAPNDQITLLLCSPHQSQLPSFTSLPPSSCWHAFGWLSHGFNLSVAVQGHNVFLLLLFSLWNFCCSKQRDDPTTHVLPRSPWPHHTRSALVTLPHKHPSHRWCPPIKRKPSKAKGPPISLLFVDSFAAPNNGQSSFVLHYPHMFRPGLTSSPMPDYRFIVVFL